MKTISYAIIRNENHKVNAVPLLERHNERRNKNYGNKDIDLSRSHLNYHLKQIQAESYLKEFDRVRTRQELKGNLRLHGEKQSTILCEFIITSDNEFFDRLGKEKTKRFFEHAYNFVTAKIGGEQYVVSAVVHMDEKTPHMHVSFIPVINGKDRKGQPCKRINCSEFWKGRDSYSRLQDEYYDFISNSGYTLERGEKGSTSEHLSVAEYKLKKAAEQLNEVTEQLKEIDSIKEIRGKSLIPNTVTLKKLDYEMLSNAAKGYVTAKKAEIENAGLKSEVRSLQTENEALKSENSKISGQLYDLDISYGQYYAETADERELIASNEKLKSENTRIGSQIHTLSAEVLASDNKTELAKTKSLLKALQEKFDKVMRFLEIQKLKDKMEIYLKPQNKSHLR